MSGLAVWNEVSVALYCADIALPIRSPETHGCSAWARRRALRWRQFGCGLL